MTPDDFGDAVMLRHDGRGRQEDIAATVVIVTYNSGGAVLELLDSLREQTETSFEIIVIDNGRNDPYVDRLMAEPLLYLRSRVNSLSYGRNIGTAYARAAVMVFLDDDCLAHNDLVAAHLRGLGDPAVLMVRGKSLPRKIPFYHHFQAHYDLGPRSLPAVNCLEGNSSAKKLVLDELGGFDPQFFGGEGLDLSFRIVSRYGNPKAIIYSPEAIIYHDFAKGLLGYLEKCVRQPQMRARLAKQYPEIMAFSQAYGPYPSSQPVYSSQVERWAVRLVGLLGTIAQRLGRCWQ